MVLKLVPNVDALCICLEGRLIPGDPLFDWQLLFLVFLREWVED